MAKEKVIQQKQKYHILINVWFIDKEPSQAALCFCRHLGLFKWEYEAHKAKQNKDFIFDINSNCKVVLSKDDKFKGNFQTLSSLGLEYGTTVQVYLKGLTFPLTSG